MVCGSKKNVASQEEELQNVTWSGGSVDQVPYGAMYYPPMVTQAMAYPVGGPVSILFSPFFHRGKLSIFIL